MAPIKFEEQIKEKFEARKIQPSVQAWDKISSELNTSTTKKKRNYKEYAMAASVIGLLIATLVFFNSEKKEIDKNKIVNTSKKGSIKKVEQPKENAMEAFDTKENIANRKADDSKNSKKSSPLMVNENIVYAKKEDVLVDANTVSNKPKVAQENKMNQEINVLINEKINSIVSQVDALVLENSVVTDAEIDALLRKAQNEILEQKIFKNSNSVDAMALLDQAEAELDLSLRDQLFETLKNGYLKVRTAVADRNK